MYHTNENLLSLYLVHSYSPPVSYFGGGDIQVEPGTYIEVVTTILTWLDEKRDQYQQEYLQISQSSTPIDCPRALQSIWCNYCDGYEESLIPDSEAIDSYITS